MSSSLQPGRNQTSCRNGDHWSYVERDLRFLSTLLIALDKNLCHTWGHPKF